MKGLKEPRGTALMMFFIWLFLLLLFLLHMIPNILPTTTTLLLLLLQLQLPMPYKILFMLLVTFGWFKGGLVELYCFWSTLSCPTWVFISSCTHRRNIEMISLSLIFDPQRY
ncbi:hypothetical protein B0T17DRAFT_327271 [Bombardia bombarda]|uniref:Uncharacterized protein n=1 Tax=Bombardia bombarda TaxID=252184 RepID=A0AA39WMJ8_9PEZI|nr:hypothetical protein B0T17DRAFT_327271 [Bombardia bombarda]